MTLSKRSCAILILHTRKAKFRIIKLLAQDHHSQGNWDLNFGLFGSKPVPLTQTILRLLQEPETPYIEGEGATDIVLGQFRGAEMASSWD